MTGLQSQLAHLPRAPCGGAVGGGEARREVPCFRRFATYGGEGTATVAARRPERCRGGGCEQERAGRGQGSLDRGLIRPVRPCRGRSGHCEPGARDRCAGVEGPGAGLLYGGDGALPESPRTRLRRQGPGSGRGPRLVPGSAGSLRDAPSSRVRVPEGRREPRIPPDPTRPPFDVWAGRRPAQCGRRCLSSLALPLLRSIVGGPPAERKGISPGRLQGVLEDLPMRHATQAGANRQAGNCPGKCIRS